MEQSLQIYCKQQARPQTTMKYELQVHKIVYANRFSPKITLNYFRVRKRR